MEHAINTKGYREDAYFADKGIYFCEECGEVAHLFRPYGKAPHFRHRRHNPNCELSKAGENGFDDNKSHLFF